MTDYEKQLEEANERLREQLERETARADNLERKLKANEWKGLNDPDVPNDAPNEKEWEAWYEKRNKPTDASSKVNDIHKKYEEIIKKIYDPKVKF
jgi:DNA repair exonuclease SbcCD ATPase subunit